MADALSAVATNASPRAVAKASWSASRKPSAETLKAAAPETNTARTPDVLPLFVIINSSARSMGLAPQLDMERPFKQASSLPLCTLAATGTTPGRNRRSAPDAALRSTASDKVTRASRLRVSEGLPPRDPCHLGGGTPAPRLGH